MIATREICKCCDKSVTVGFSVPDKIWEVVANGLNVLCLACFTRRADRMLIRWDDDIQFWPVSRVCLLIGEPEPPMTWSVKAKA